MSWLVEGKVIYDVCSVHFGRDWMTEAVKLRKHCAIDHMATHTDHVTLQQTVQQATATDKAKYLGKPFFIRVIHNYQHIAICII